MKKVILTISFIAFAYNIHAQIAIEKTTVDGDALLDFASGTTKGIILPIVETLPSSPSNGTILMDSNDETIKIYENNSWVDLSSKGDVSNVIFNSAAENNGGVIMGAGTSDASGVLVLESSTKALVLPKIESPHLNVKSPHAGMLCYDTVSKSMAIFDGARWHFWK